MALPYPAPPNEDQLKMYFLDRLEPEFSADPAGQTMNERLRQLIHPPGRGA